MVLAIDILLELPFADIIAGTVPLHDLAHLAIESLAAGLLFVVLFGLRGIARHYQIERDATAATLTGLRQDFDGVIHAHFDRWGLTRAERDTALLTLRGMKIADIAAARSVREGTVKAQLSAIFRKSGVSTRSEFIGLLFEELLDQASTEAPTGRPAAAG